MKCAFSQDYYTNKYMPLQKNIPAGNASGNIVDVLVNVEFMATRPQQRRLS